MAAMTMYIVSHAKAYLNRMVLIYGLKRGADKPVNMVKCVVKHMC